MVQSAAFGSYYPVAVDFSQTKRPYAEGVAHGKELVFGHDNQRISPLYAAHGITDFFQPVLAGSGMDQIGDDFRISGAVESIALFAEFFVKMFGVDDIAVVGDGHYIFAVADDDRLGVADAAGTGGRIAVMTYGDISGELT